MAWSIGSSVTAGSVLTASRYNQDVVANLTELAPFFSAWTAYTPVWTNLTLGNGTNTGRYVQVGKMVIYQGRLTWGSTTSATASNTTVSLPVTAKQTTGIDFSGTGYINDVGTRFYVVTCYQASGTTMIFLHSGDAGAGVVNSTNPQTWVNTDVIAWQVVYEAA